MTARRFSFPVLILASSMASSSAASLSIDPAPLTQIFDNFNDGVSTATNFGNMSDVGEAGGISSVNMPIGAPDPQFQYPSLGVPFAISTYPYLRVNTRGSVGGASQIFPLPAAGPTVLNYGTATGFSESRLQFVPPANGSGLRFDPLGGGTGAVETFDFDYVMLDRVRTIGLAEFDYDGAMDGWTVVGNGHLINTGTSAATSTFTATTAGVDPIMQRAGLNIDTNIFDTLEIRMAFDPASSSRFEFFWGTSSFPGPAGGQSIVEVGQLIRDGNMHTYRFDMSDEAAWDGNLNILRIDPLADGDAAAGRRVEIDYIRLLDGSAIPIPEPSSILLTFTGLLVAFGRRRR
jgi:hypothetical protein